MKIRIGSRESALAVAQTNLLVAHFAGLGYETELVTMKTTGDMILDKPLDMIGGKGLFTKELDRALLAGRVDLTVHSFKDMPAQLDDRLPVIAASKREDPRDALVLPAGADGLVLEKPIGCSSLRRTLHLRRLYPDAVIAPLRGNVLTRLNRLDGGEFSAIVLACAGLKRLGLGGRISHAYDVSEMLPAACQGILAVQARRDFDVSLLEGFNDKDAYDAAVAERSFIRALDGGCSSPIAAYALVSGGSVTLTGLYVDSDDNEFIGSVTGTRAEAEAIGITLAKRLAGGKI